MFKKLHRYPIFLIMAVFFFWLSPAAAQAADGGDMSGGFVFPEGTAVPVLPNVETVYTAGGGQIIWTPETDEAGTVLRGTLTLRNAVINNPDTMDATRGSGILLTVPFDLVLEGTNEITSAGYGICVSDSQHSTTHDLTIGGGRHPDHQQPGAGDQSGTFGHH